ncbi:lysophospholipid acyltransferase family protein [Clostridium grantii]|uniref:1-acyl-sn-glycerol-3-phosphate acyltransferase n=1 Tax=Clostridium grantii DSM 8605 TaxID=1121316 RepID=A0A1M5QLN2_9CLOT|nr:lysophospholipid acyltransferase family protein [Clostridium grantii]SHH15045.1 1-acyl-sn-glycerol-3-phosphate acyltransferase [Clostridium grantii DSM 8605]
MIKLLWYTYFAFFVLFHTCIAKIKSFFISKKSIEAADDYLFQKAQHMCNFLLKKSKTTTHVSGLENIPEGPVVFVSNHQAMFDGFLIIGNVGKHTGFIAKKEILKIPVLPFWFKAIKTVFIDRSNIREGMKAINEGVERLKSGYSMLIFPEGTRSLKSEMIDFKKGSIKLALKANVPIVPITVDGTYRVLEVGKQVTGHSIAMIVHKPIYIDQLSIEEKKNLTETLHHTIETSLTKLVKDKITH